MTYTVSGVALNSTHSLAEIFFCISDAWTLPKEIHTRRRHDEAALPSKHSSGCHMAAEEEANQRTTSGREIRRMRCGQEDTSGGLEED